MLLGKDDVGTRILYRALADQFVIAKVILEPPPSRYRLLVTRARRLGVPVVVGQVLFQLLVLPYLRLRDHGRVRELERTFDLVPGTIPADRLVRVTSVNSAEALAALRAAHPAAVVVSGTRILSRAVLGAVDAPFVNAHAGITPRFRGVHGGYWALVERAPDACGVTIHLVDTGIDTGPVLAQATIHPAATDSFVSYPLLQLAAAIPLLVMAVRDALNGSLRPQSRPAGLSRLWSHPTLWGYLWTRATRGVR